MFLHFRPPVPGWTWRFILQVTVATAVIERAEEAPDKIEQRF